MEDKGYLKSQMALGAEKAEKAARKTLRKVYHRLGFDSDRN
jgi:hypothetical protein